MPVSGIRTCSPRRTGAKRLTLSKGSAGRPSRVYTWEASVGSALFNLFIEEQQILTFYVEDNGASIRALRSGKAGFEYAMQQERRISCFGCDTGNSGDIEVRAPCTVQKLKISVDWFSVS